MDHNEQREMMVSRYLRLGYISNSVIVEALRKVPRENFMHNSCKEQAYHDAPFPIPGDGRQTISAPYTYPLFYENLGLTRGDRFLEVGLGSGYGAALAREIVGNEGLVVSIEVNQETFNFGRKNLVNSGYRDIVIIHGDGSKGYPCKAPYDKICVTAACPKIPAPLVEQLNAPGKLTAPVGPISVFQGQDLVLLTKDENGTREKAISKVVYVPLVGEHGWKNV